MGLAVAYLAGSVVAGCPAVLLGVATTRDPVEPAWDRIVQGPPAATIRPHLQAEGDAAAED